MSIPAAQTAPARLPGWLNTQRAALMLRTYKQMRSAELNIHREPSIVEVFEHVIIGGVRIRYGAAVKPRRAHLRKTRTLTKRAARRARRGVGH
jgi:hypothetical protein